jgi:predicted dehydrogenase
VVGLSHDHAYGFFPQLRGRTDVELAGVVETNRALIEIYSRRFNLSSNLFFPSLDDLFAQTKVQAVATFTSTFEHRAVVERCAMEHVDVMMEKPLAVNMEHARAIEAAARRGSIQVFVNYETTWYPGNRAAYEMVHDRKEVGEIRRIVVHDGHRGPKEIGCSTNFLAWLTDPVLNGGGALNDFGCYGRLGTWFMNGQRLCRSGHDATHQAGCVPRVEDEAIVITYPGTGNPTGVMELAVRPQDRKFMGAPDACCAECGLRVRLPKQNKEWRSRPHRFPLRKLIRCPTHRW